MEPVKYDTPCNCVRCTTARAAARRVRQEVEADLPTGLPTDLPTDLPTGPLAGTVPYVYVPKTAEAKAKEEAEALSCPLCGGGVGWNKNDTYELGGVRFVERIQECASTGGCWIGTVALFPCGDGFKRKAKISRWVP